MNNIPPWGMKLQTQMTMKRKIHRQKRPFPLCTWALLGMLAFLACGGDQTADEARTEISVQFAAVVGDRPFQCGEMYDELGTNAAALSFTDLRLYVHDIRLFDASGAEHTVELTDDGVWQQAGVALLDFEDGCGNGTSQLNGTVTGQVRQADYQGIRFKVGVPEALNSPTTVLENRGSPLNQSSMFWSWRSGYKFVRLDSASSFFRFHLGAVGCDDDFSCSEPNIPEFEVRGYSAADDVILLDVRTLLEDTDLTMNTMGTAPGCMGESSDPDCSGLFDHFGLGSSESESAFRLRPRG